LSTQTLTEAATLERARLDIKKAAGQLTGTNDLLRLKALKVDPPARMPTFGGRTVTGTGYRQFAAKALTASKRGRELPITEDVPLADFGPDATKTLLRMGLVTSAGAFQSIDESGEYAPTRRPLSLLDLVRPGTTNEGSVVYMRQTTYTPVAAETAEATSVTTGTKPEATLPFEQVTSPVESIPSWAPATTRALADVDEMRGLVDQQLLYDARRRLEAQIPAGSGTSPNLRGLDSTTGVLTQAKAPIRCPWPSQRVSPRWSPPATRRPPWPSTRTIGLTG
jgi:hypothetical protein